MKKEDYLKDMQFPVKATLRLYPNGNIMQYWADNPALYANAFGQYDDVHYYLGGHSGLDIHTWYGDEVRACQDGKVVFVKTDPITLGGLQVNIDSPELDDNGETVVIQHTYAHLKDILVTSGQQVKKGDVIGHEGNTGMVASGGNIYWGNAPGMAGTHLHFGLYEFVKKGDAFVRRYEVMRGSFDPLPWFTDPDPLDNKLEGNWEGTKILLANMIKLLTKWQNQWK